MEFVIPTVTAECLDTKHNALVVHLRFLFWKSQTDVSVRSPEDILSRTLRVFAHSRQTDTRVGTIIMSFSADEPRISFAFLYVNMLRVAEFRKLLISSTHKAVKRNFDFRKKQICRLVYKEKFLWITVTDFRFSVWWL
jgi:hypothetical protein